MILSVRHLVRAVSGRLISGFPNDSFERVSIDTRTLRPGDLFIALKGPRFDGHDYLRTAADRGARAVVVQTLDDRLSFDPVRTPSMVAVPDSLKALQDLARYIRHAASAQIIGITGSNGKTTTKEMLAAILRKAGKTLATRGNFNNHIGLPLTLTELASDHLYAVIEMGTSQKGDMELLADLTRPQVGMITNVGKDHLAFLGSPEGVLAENRVLFDRMPKTGIALINLDDPLLQPLAGRLPCRTVTYGYAAEADVRAESVQAGQSPLKFTLILGKNKFQAELETPDALQVLNALAAAAAAYALGIAPENILQGLRMFKPAAMRLQVFQRSDGSLLINDAYNANPSSVRASVDSFCRSYPDRHRWVVLGDMRELGDTARPEHQELGHWLAQQPIDRLWLYGRDMRFTEAAVRAGKSRVPVERFRKKRYLIDALQQALSSEKAAVLFKASRSMKLEQVIEPLQRPLSAPVKI